MGTEIERKFLVTSEGWREGAEPLAFRQGYLSTHQERTVRVRVKGEAAVLTIKGLTTGATRAEYEYEIPMVDANEMLTNLCQKPIIEKTRHRVKHGRHLWEIDEFHGVNLGLVVAEVELESEAEAYETPPWLGEEVTGDRRYYNANLVAEPFISWS